MYNTNEKKIHLLPLIPTLNEKKKAFILLIYRFFYTLNDEEKKKRLALFSPGSGNASIIRANKLPASSPISVSKGHCGYQQRRNRKIIFRR